MNAFSIAPEPVVTVAKRIIAARAAEVASYARLYPLLLAAMGEIPRGMTHPTHKERIARVRDYLLDLRAKTYGFEIADEHVEFSRRINRFLSRLILRMRRSMFPSSSILIGSGNRTS